MKRFIIYFLLLAVLQTVTANAQNENKEPDAKPVLIKLLDLSNKKDYENINPIVAYRGDDKERDLKDNFNLDDKAEFNKLKRICNQIFALLKISEYEIGKLTKSINEGIAYYTYEVEFKSKSQSITKEFMFILHNNKFLLAEMK